MKTLRHSLSIIMAGSVLWAGGCASKPSDTSDALGALFSQPTDLEQRLEKASKFPLGSRDNPVRVHMPKGEHEYLLRLRCKDNRLPQYMREGSFGTGVFGHIIDGYAVKCVGSEPAAATIFMDMYFPGYKENRAPDGFTIIPEQP